MIWTGVSNSTGPAMWWTLTTARGKPLPPGESDGCQFERASPTYHPADDQFCDLPKARIVIVLEPGGLAARATQ
jgi:hypothetical protein